MIHPKALYFILVSALLMSGCSVDMPAQNSNVMPVAPTNTQVTNDNSKDTSQENSSDTINTQLPLGDGKTSTTAPKTGFIYLCRSMQGNGGAFQDGAWIHGDTWNPAEKTVTVDGSVTWSNAAVSISLNGATRSIQTNGLPSQHDTGVFPVATNDDAYQYDRNPNHITQQSIQLALPAQPTASSSPHCVGGEVGIALTGVPIFNGLDAGGRDAVAHEIQDSFGGHPQIQGMYHYHHISKVVASLGDTENGMTLVGYAFDGFGIYTDTEFGATLMTSDLDECHGHSHQITWDGEIKILYHYHATQDYPYTVSCFHGESTVDGPLGQ